MLHVSCANAKNLALVKHFVGGEYQVSALTVCLSLHSYNFHSKNGHTIVVTKYFAKLFLQ